MAWPALTGVPAFVVALLAAAELALSHYPLAGSLDSCRKNLVYSDLRVSTNRFYYFAFTYRFSYGGAARAEYMRA